MTIVDCGLGKAWGSVKRLEVGGALRLRLEGIGLRPTGYAATRRAGEKRRGEAETRRRGEEGKRQRAEDRGRRSEVRDRRSENREQLESRSIVWFEEVTICDMLTFIAPFLASGKQDEIFNRYRNN